jgi:hypothetical protein
MKAIIFRDWKEFNAAKNWIMCAACPIILIILSPLLFAEHNRIWGDVITIMMVGSVYTPTLYGLLMMAEDRESGVLNTFHASGHAPFTYVCAKMIVPLMVSLPYAALYPLYGLWAGAFTAKSILSQLPIFAASAISITLVAFTTGFPICLILRKPEMVVVTVELILITLWLLAMIFVTVGWIPLPIATAILLAIIGGALAVGLPYYHNHYPTTLAAIR